MNENEIKNRLLFLQGCFDGQKERINELEKTIRFLVLREISMTTQLNELNNEQIIKNEKDK